MATRRTYGNDEFAAFGLRIVAAFRRRIATGDIEGLRDLATLSKAVDTATGEAARQLVADGYSWADIGRVLGIPRQNAHRKYATDPTGKAEQQP